MSIFHSVSISVINCQFESVCLCLTDYLSASLSICLSVCLSVCLFLSLSFLLHPYAIFHPSLAQFSPQTNYLPVTKSAAVACLALCYMLIVTVAGLLDS